MSPRPAACLVLSVALAAGLAAAPLARLSAPTLSPSAFRVGERVTLVARVSFEGGDPVAFSLATGSGLGEGGRDEDPELRSAVLAKTAEGWVLTLGFIPWSPGPGSIPAMLLAGTSFPVLHYETRSVLGPADRDIDGPRGQLDPPGTTLYLYGFLGLIGLLVLAAALFALWILPGARALLARWKAKEAWKAFDRTLGWLERDSAAAETAAFYAILSRALRIYLARRILAEAEALTPLELAALPVEDFPAPSFREELVELLAESDRSRFGGERAGTEDAVGRSAEAARLRSAAARARSLGRRAEEHLDVRA